MAYFHFLCIFYPNSISCLSKSLLTFISTYDDDLTYFSPDSTSQSVSFDRHDKCPNRKSNPINLFYSNVRSLLPKANLLENYVSIYSPSIVALTETWLEPTIPSSLFSPTSYVSYRRDRVSKRGGGSLILVNDSLISKPLDIYPASTETESSIDAVAASLSLRGGKTLGVLCIYRPPSSSLDDFYSMISILDKFLSFNFQYNIILGDFNYPDIFWPITASSPQSKLFLTFCQENFLTQHITVPTRIASESILDLVLSTQGTEISDLRINEEFGSSDHSIIQLSLNACPTFFNRSIRRRNFKAAKWDIFCRLLLPSQEWLDAISTGDIDFVWDHFLDSLNSALDQVAPYRFVSARNSVSTSKTRTALRYKRRCYRELVLKPSIDNLISYKRSKLIARRILDENIAVREERIINAKNPKIFWSYVNRRLGSDSRIKFIAQDDVCTHDSQDMADLFNDYFVSTFAATSSNLATPCTSSSTVDSSFPSLLTHIDLSPEDVSLTLNKIPPKTSVDADNVSYMILKNGGSSIAFRLFQLYSLSLRVSRIPSSWKSAVVSPIFKKGSKSDIRNYRPISVTSCCSRILERIINEKISSFLTTHSIIKCSQHGFTHGKSTDTLLISYYDYVTRCLDRNLAIDSVFFDFQKAFDSVPHHKLITRLFSVGIQGNLLDWLKDFLSNRTQAVKIDRSRSNPLPVNSGVIQGTVLGPTLFNIFVNDIDESLQYCKIFKYADDIRIFLSSARNPRDLCNMHHKIQQDIDNIVAWSLASGLKLNASKCFSVSFGNCDSVNLYTLNGVSIPKNDTFSDLGLTVLSPFNFKFHVDKIVSKAFRKLGLINRIFKNKTKHSVTSLYKTYVRSSLEYSSVVWSPFTISSIDSIERVQRRMCRLIPAIRHLPYKQQLKSLGLLSLRARRLRFQLITLFKIQKGLLNISFDDFFLLHGLHGTRGHNLRIIPKFSRYNYRLHFFTVSVISYWNQLSQEDVDAPSVASFKLRLHSFFARNDIW